VKKVPEKVSTNIHFIDTTMTVIQKAILMSHWLTILKQNYQIDESFQQILKLLNAHQIKRIISWNATFKNCLHNRLFNIWVTKTVKDKLTSPIYEQAIHQTLILLSFTKKTNHESSIHKWKQFFLKKSNLAFES